MRVRYFFAADSALLSPDGKFGVLGGGVQVISGATFPLVQPQMSVIVNVEFEPAELPAAKVFTFTLAGEPNELLVHYSQQILPSTRLPGIPPSCTIVLNLAGVTFPHPGAYALSVAINGTELDSIRIILQHNAAEQQKGP